jgi:periplasmic protein TonB
MFGKIRTFTLLCSFALAVSASAITVAEITDVSPKVDEAPTPLRTFAPDYPTALRAAKVNGVVSVVLVVDETGEVLAAEVAKSSHDDFKGPALDAIRRWKFKPAKLDGKNVKVKVTIPVRFTTE